MTGPRIPEFLPADMTPRQLDFHGRYTTGPRADPSSPFRLSDERGVLLGPPSAWVLAPEIGLALEQLGWQMRYGIHLSDKGREAAILAVAYHERSPFELYAHEAAGRAAGFTDEDLAAIAERRVPADADEELVTVLEAAWRLLDAGTLDDAEFASAVDVLGLPRVFELVTLVGYYRMVALQLAAFRILPPSSR